MRLEQRTHQVYKILLQWFRLPNFNTVLSNITNRLSRLITISNYDYASSAYWAIIFIENSKQAKLELSALDYRVTAKVE